MLDVTAWNPDYVEVYARRQRAVEALRARPELAAGQRQYYAARPTEWIDDWVETYDPRNAGDGANLVRMPLVLFKRQRELVEFLHSLVNTTANGLIEKSRDMGATWVACAFSVWAWLYLPGASVGWGSRKEPLVDRAGDPDSIFEKMRIIIRNLPREMLPKNFREDRCFAHMRIVNPETAASITGEVGDNIGRGGRKLFYFKDESAWYEHPEMIEASLMDNTRIQIDISSVAGPTTVFQRRRDVSPDWEPGQEMKRGSTYVFVMDWRDHPHKTQEWYDQRRDKAKSEGLLHKFAQEVDRNPLAAMEGIIIDAEWVKAAIDADQKLGLEDDGLWGAALDVADGGSDSNALATRKGVIVKSLEEWGERDTGVTTRRAVGGVELLAPIALQYDCVGLGAGVKAEANRLVDDKLMPKGVSLIAWNAADEVLNKDENLIRGDVNTPLNGDLFGNLKAQGWWNLARRFECTWRAVRKAEGDPEFADFTWDADDLISLPSSLPLLRKLQKELSQPVWTKSTKLKMIVDKTPDGMRSPNLADALMMMFWPMPSLQVVIPSLAVSKMHRHIPRRPPRRF